MRLLVSDAVFSITANYLLSEFGRSYTASISRLKKEGYDITILKYTNDKRYTRGYSLEKSKEAAPKSTPAIYNGLGCLYFILFAALIFAIFIFCLSIYNVR